MSWNQAPPGSLRVRLGALAERDFRLLFSSTTVSSLGDGVATIALAFAVLEVSGSATDLGLVLAARPEHVAAVDDESGHAAVQATRALSRRFLVRIP